MEEQDGVLSRDFHNLYVILILGILLLWTGKVAYQLAFALDLNHRLSRTPSLQLEGMSIYAKDFQMLIRQHFNQILRIRRTVPPKLVTRHELSVHLHPDSIACVSADEEKGSPTGLGVEFTVDALVPCCVRLYWGVSAQACNDFVQHRHASSVEAQPLSRRAGNAVASGLRGMRGRWTSRSAAYANPESTRSLLEMEELGLSTSTSSSSSAVSPPTEATARVGGLGDIGGAAPEDQLFAAGQYLAHSRDFFLPAGNGQRYVTPPGDLIQPSQWHFDVNANWLREGHTPIDESAVVPLIIVISAQRRPSSSLREVQNRPVAEARGQMSLVRFRRGEETSSGTETNAGTLPSPGTGHSGPLGAPEVMRQLCYGDLREHPGAYEVHGIFGFEDENENDCMICYARPKNVLMLPCRHCSVCHSCLRSLREEKCPLCRTSFSSYLTLPLVRSTAPAGNGAWTSVAQ